MGDPVWIVWRTLIYRTTHEELILESILRKYQVQIFLLQSGHIKVTSSPHKSKCCGVFKNLHVTY